MYYSVQNVDILIAYDSFFHCRWGIVFMLCLMVAIPVFILKFVPPPKITVRDGNSTHKERQWPHIYEGPDIEQIILFVLSSFIQVCTH